MIFPVDFTVLDMEEDEDIPLILGRPFLATGKALIDVGEGKLTLRALEKQVTFDIHAPVPSFDDSKTCCDIIAKDEFTDKCIENGKGQTTLESVLSELDDWEEEEHELDKNRYELPLQNNAVNYQMSEAHKSELEQAPILSPLPEPTVLHDNYSVFKQELQGHFDGYGEMLGWTKVDIDRVSSLISTYRTLVESEAKGMKHDWDLSLKKMVMEELFKLLDAS